MWVKINGKPLCIANIKNISAVIKCDGTWYKKQYSYYEHRKTVLLNKINKTIPLSLPNGIQYITRKEQVNAQYLDEHPVYVIIIQYITEHQRYMNDCYNGIGNIMEEMYSRLYENESEAIAAQEHLLCEINEIEKNLINIQL